VPPSSESERDLDALAGELRRLEGDYTKFFAGRLPRPPLEARARLDREFRKCAPDSAAGRFRLQTLQSRYSSFVELWDRAMRAREEGRPGPLVGRRAAASEPETPKLGSEVYAAVMNDPGRQAEVLRSLYDAMMDARRQTGHDVVPFERFSDLVRDQVARLQASGASDVMFRVSVNDGRPNLTARPVKRKSSDG
jgi:hypothetical protein